jgi:hypothetical protein
MHIHISFYLNHVSSNVNLNALRIMLNVINIKREYVIQCTWIHVTESQNVTFENL